MNDTHPLENPFVSKHACIACKHHFLVYFAECLRRIFSITHLFLQLVGIPQLSFFR